MSTVKDCAPQISESAQAWSHSIAESAALKVVSLDKSSISLRKPCGAEITTLFPKFLSYRKSSL